LLREFLTRTTPFHICGVRRSESVSGPRSQARAHLHDGAVGKRLANAPVNCGPLTRILRTRLSMDQTFLQFLDKMNEQAKLERAQNAKLVKYQPAVDMKSPEPALGRADASGRKELRLPPVSSTLDRIVCSWRGASVGGLRLLL
jgi:hypothetical protein